MTALERLIRESGYRPCGRELCSVIDRGVLSRVVRGLLWPSEKTVAAIARVIGRAKNDIWDALRDNGQERKAAGKQTARPHGRKTSHGGTGGKRCGARRTKH